MKSIYKTLFACLVVILIASCAKERKDIQKKMILLTNPSGWLRTKVEEKAPNGIWVDITGTPTSIEADNLLIFDPWFAWALDEGALKFPGNPQKIATGTWSFLDNETKIQITDGNLMEIEKLTKTELVTVVATTIGTFKYSYILGGSE